MLISNIEELKELIPTILSDDFSLFSQSIKNAEDWLAAEVVGRPLLVTIKESEEQELKRLAREIVAFRAYSKAIPGMDVMETSNGFVVLNDNRYAPASTARVNALITQFNENTELAVQRLQEYLEGRPEYHEEWQICEGCTILRGALIPTLSEYKKYGIWEGGRKTYVEHRPVFYRLTRIHIEPVVSSKYLLELVGLIAGGGELPAKDAEIVELLRYALTALFEKNMTAAASALNSATATMCENIDNYPSYKESPNYAAYLSRSRPAGDTGVGVFM